MQEDLVKFLLGVSVVFMGVSGISYWYAYKTFKRAIELMETLTDLIWRESNNNNCANEETD